MSNTMWKKLSETVLAGDSISREDALAMLDAPDDEMLLLIDAAFTLRRHYFGKGVGLHVIRNARSGHCSEDCSYCSQSARATAPLERYPLQSVDQLLDGARQAFAMKAKRYCIVTGGRAPSEDDLAVLCAAATRIKNEMPIEVCTSLGLLTTKQACRLRTAGVDRYNHNLETTEAFYPRICTTHEWKDRMATVRSVKEAGLELCSGGIVGMGETATDRIELAFALREADADSIPVNFFNPRPGTDLEHLPPLSATDSLRTLAMFRFVHPACEIRVAGGRERCLGALQVMALYIADSMFTTGYLTTAGQGFDADVAMIEAAGFHVSDVENV